MPSCTITLKELPSSPSSSCKVTCNRSELHEELQGKWFLHMTSIPSHTILPSAVVV